MTIEAYEPPDPNEYVRPVAFGVTALLIAWNVTGWILGEGWTFEGFFIAAMTGAFQLLSFNASAQMRRASAKVKCKRVESARKFWWGTLLMCSGWSAYSAHHAFGVIVATDVQWVMTFEGIMAILSNAPALIVLTVAAFIEPFLPWAIETVEAAPRAIAPAAKAEPETTPQPLPHISSHGAARTVARELMRQTPRNASKRRGGASETRTAERGPPLSERELRQAVIELTEQGKVISLRGVAKHLDVPVSRVERSPAKALLYAAA